MASLRRILPVSSNSLIKGSAVVFIGTMVANVGSYLYHLLMGRILGPRGYGELSSLISLLYILGVPMLVIQTTLVKYFSEIRAKGTLGQAKTLFVKSTKYFLILLVLFGVAFAAATPFITGYLHLTSWRFPLWIYMTVAISALIMVGTSYLQGSQKFNAFSFMLAFAIIAKLFMSVPVARNGIEAVLIAALAAGLLTYGLYIVIMRPMLATQSAAYALTKLDALKYAFPTLLTLAGVTSLYSTDVLLARHYLTALDGGIYAAVAVLGKVIFYATSAIGSVIFPIIAERVVSDKPIIKLVRMAVFLVTGGSALITAFYGVLPGLVTGVLFGSAYAAAIPYLFIFGVFMIFFSVSYVLVLVHLAAGNTKVWKMTVTIALAQIALISLRHGTISDIIYMNIMAAVLMLIGILMFSRKYLFGAVGARIQV